MHKHNFKLTLQYVNKHLVSRNSPIKIPHTNWSKRIQITQNLSPLRYSYSNQLQIELNPIPIINNNPNAHTICLNQTWFHHVLPKLIHQNSNFSPKSNSNSRKNETTIRKSYRGRVSELSPNIFRSSRVERKKSYSVALFLTVYIQEENWGRIKVSLITERSPSPRHVWCFVYNLQQWLQSPFLHWFDKN